MDQWRWQAKHCPGAMQLLQKLCGHDGRYYDVLVLELPSGEVRDVYFDLTATFKHLKALSLRLAARRRRASMTVPHRPIRYELDDLRRRVTVTVQGPFQTDDILAIMARQRAEQTWTYGILYDLRGMTDEPTVAALRQLMSEAAELRQEEGPRGPVALVATAMALYSRLCTYAALGRSTTLRIEVFRDRGEAEQWLTAQTKATEKGRE